MIKLCLLRMCLLGAWPPCSVLAHACMSMSCIPGASECSNSYTSLSFQVTECAYFVDPLSWVFQTKQWVGGSFVLNESTVEELVAFLVTLQLHEAVIPVPQETHKYIYKNLVFLNISTHSHTTALSFTLISYSEHIENNFRVSNTTFKDTHLHSDHCI